MILDGNSIVNRAFYGIRLLSTKDGLYTNAVYGFLSILMKLMEEERPEALCVAFDLSAPTFRHERYEAYKAQRKGMPDELAMQMPLLKEVLAAMNIPIYELEGYEADDIIGTMSRLCTTSGHECVIVTGDKDSLQLIGGGVRVKLVSTRMGQTVEKDYTRERFLEDYGFGPELMVDLKALMGDASDNIPGVKGVGEKTAMDLVARYGGIEEIYKGLDSLDIKDSVKKKLSEGEESARLSYELATIDKDVPIEMRPEDSLISEPDREKLYALFLRLEFSKFIERMGLGAGSGASHKTVVTGEVVSEAVTDGEGAERLIRACGGAPVCLICTDDLSATAVLAGGCMYAVLRHDFDGDYDGLIRRLMSPEIAKVGHDVKHLMRVLMGEGIPIGGFMFDTALAAYLLSPTDGSYELSKLSVSYLGCETPDAKAYKAPDAFAPLSDISGALGALFSHVSVMDSIWPILQSELLGQGMRELFETVELPLCTVLADMEHTGFAVDANMLKDFGVMLDGRIETAQASIFSHAGEEFNINSTKKLGEILFDKLNLPPVKKTKTGYSTNIEVLEKLKGSHPVIADIIEYRQLTKLKSTYVDGLLKVIAPDGRIHTSFMMTVTATGRLSSTEPNLQNIPVRTELGSELRKMFVAGSGMLLVDADYSQIELRLLAHISGDRRMQEAFLSGEDIHRVTASQVLGIPPEDVTPGQRSSAKAVNFGIVYGISDFSLAEDIGVSRYEARQYIDSYLEKYSGVRDYMKTIVEKAREEGYVSTLMGRRRYLPEISSKNFNIRSFGERVALNTPIQGTAADIIKLAMVRVYERLKAEKMKSRLILQIHDELIIESPEDEAEMAAALLKEEMSGVMELSVPLLADAKTGRSWYDAK